MKTKTYLSLLAIAVMATAAFRTHAANAPMPAAAADTTVSPARTELDKRLLDAVTFYLVRQSAPRHAIPNWVVANCKGVIIISHWSASAGLGSSGGYAVGWEKSASGNFVGPAFYNVTGASLGVQLGVSESMTVGFLMSDKALHTLIDPEFVWSAGVKLVADKENSTMTSGDNGSDVILYQKSVGLDVGAMVTGTDVTVNNEANRAFYNNPTLTPAEIFAGKVPAPAIAKEMVDTLKRQAAVGAGK